MFFFLRRLVKLVIYVTYGSYSSFRGLILKFVRVGSKQPFLWGYFSFLSKAWLFWYLYLMFWSFKDFLHYTCENSNVHLPNMSSGNCLIYSSVEIFYLHGLVESHIMYARAGIQQKAPRAPYADFQNAFSDSFHFCTLPCKFQLSRPLQTLFSFPASQRGFQVLPEAAALH